MGVICYVCQAHFQNVRILCRHLRMIHGLLPGKTLKLRCAQVDCCHVFGTFSGFKKHLNSKHRNDIRQQESPTTRVHAFQADDVQNNDVNDAQDIEEPSTSSREPSAAKAAVDLCASAIAQLQASGVSQSALNTFLSSMEEVFVDIHSQAEETALKCVTAQDTSTKTSISQAFVNLENPFAALNSQAKRNKYFEKKWNLVKPVEKVLGVRFENRRNKSTGTYDQVVVTDKFSYVPILETLKSILINPNLTQFFATNLNSQSGVYSDIRDGLYLKTHPLFLKEKITLQIQLFYDDFETANPLGSKKGIHKLGAIYFTLRNFPPKFNSVLANIHLCALFHSQDIKTYGFDNILEPLISDIKVLEREGIMVPTFPNPVFGTVIQVVGDNLAIHGLFGFVESFSARNCCRFCVTEKSDFQTLFSENDMVLRTKEIHSEHCKMLLSNPQLSHYYGVKRSSLLNTLEYFNTADNFSVDIMHDILEGVAQFEIKLLLEYIQENHASAREIARRIDTFNYGYIDRRNRPPAVKLSDGSNDLGLNAIQSWCLLRNLPLIFGDLIHTSDDYWHLLGLLIQIANIVFSPVVTHGMTVFLKHIIIEHHQLFKRLFPSKNLLPKHHFMTHYPRSIRNIGPIIHTWSMRYEAKHKYFKTQLKTFKNITKTLANKHQRHMALQWECFKESRLVTGPGKSVALSDLSGCVEISNKLTVPTNIAVLSVKWLKYYGTEYRPGLLVCVTVVNEMPVFCKLNSIIVKDDNVVLCGTDVETICFDEHYQAFEIEIKPTQTLKIFNIEELLYFKPVDVQMSYGSDNSSTYVVPYCHLMTFN